LGAFRRFFPAALIGTSIRRGMVFSRHGWCEGWMMINQSRSVCDAKKE